MTFQAERINTPISTQELERRWAAVRAAMHASHIDALIMQNNNDHMGGYVKWFIDLPAVNGYPVTVVFPADDDMTVIAQGPIGVIQELSTEGDGLRRGVKYVRNTSIFVSVGYSLAQDTEQAEKALEKWSRGTIGLVGTGTLPISLIDPLRRKYNGAQFVDATKLVDQIKVPKSAEELELCRRAAAVQDDAMKTTFAAIKPGMRDQDVAGVAIEAVFNGGGEQGIYLCSSNPSDAEPGTVVPISSTHTLNRALRKGDVFHILIETNGPGGMYTELGRTCVLGKAPQELKDEFALMLQARQYTLSLLKPGASCKDIWDAHNAFMRSKKLPEERRLYCHGQGYDLVEPPLVRFDETMPIAESMNIACHPTWISSHFFNSITDNYFIGPNGVSEHVHKFPEIITEIDC
jgi:Xaa-Pro aminopeptidase